MKINKQFIDKIFSLKIKLITDKDKKKLSKFDDFIPMYDIRSEKIYPINKMDLYNRLTKSDYRFINDGIYDWLLTLYNKYKKDKFKYNLEVISNYNLDILIETSYNTLYKYSTHLGLSISICKRNSFNPFIEHLHPYYTKLELIKLGQNMNIMKDNITVDKLLDRQTLYNVCVKISHNDVSYREIEEHHEHIIKENITSYICFYSYIGSYIFNNFLRNNQSMNLNSILFNGLKEIVSKMETSPPLLESYQLYRFIWDDTFINKLKIGDIYSDPGFISTTRDPFYSPGYLGTFGLILVKINIPKNKKGIGLFIENFSLFPKEEEFLLPPFTNLKLISKNNNFKYHHIDDKFEKLITQKYEFEFIDVNYKKFFNLYKNYQLISDDLYTDISLIKLNGIDRLHLIKQFIEKYENNYFIYLKINNKKYKIFYQWFDSTYNNAYEKLYFNKINDGILLIIFDNFGSPYLNLEIGNKLIVNYLNKFYYSNINHKIEDLEIIYNISKLFYFKDVLITHEYPSFLLLKNLYLDVKDTYLISKHFNYTIYNYLKTGNKYLSHNKYISYKIGYWYLDKYFNKKIDKVILEQLPSELHSCCNTYKELYIIVVEKYFYYYNIMISFLDPEIFENEYLIFNISKQLIVNRERQFIRPNMDYLKKSDTDDFNLLYRYSIIRRN